MLGYYVYPGADRRRPVHATDNESVDRQPVTPTSVASTNVDMVRAVGKLEVSGSGELLQREPGDLPEPSMVRLAHRPVTLFQPTNTTIFGVSPTVQLCADTVDPAKIVTNVVFYANDMQIGRIGQFATPIP